MNRKISPAAMLPLLLAIIAIPLPLVHSVDPTIVYVNPEIIDYSLVGQIFTVNVSVANVTNLAYWQVRLGFDPTVLNCTNATVPQDNIFEGYVQVSWLNINNAEGFILIGNRLDQAGSVNGSGTLFQIEFKSLIEGSSELNFQFIKSPMGTVLLHDGGSQIDFNTIDGTVEVNIAQKDITNVPFYYQDNKYYSGPAALKMIFVLYGENISQQEIAEVARTHPNVTYNDELRRAAHFSNMSTSMGQEMPENITGYSLRKLGYGAFERSGLTLTQLQASVRNNHPVIVSTWHDLSKQNSHYRVVVGYNLTHIKIHDPWNKATWGGTYGGANTTIDYPTFLALWNQSNYWGLFAHPWQVKVAFKMLGNQPYKFNVTANIRYICPETFREAAYSASSANVTITLPPELSLDIGETPTKTLGTGIFSPGDSATINWIVKGNTSGIFNVTIEAIGKIAGTVSAHESYPTYNYQDLIGGKGLFTIWLGFPGDINGDGKVDIVDLAKAAKAFGTYGPDYLYPGSAPHARWDPMADVNNDNKIDILDIAFVAKNYGTIY